MAFGKNRNSGAPPLCSRFQVQGRGAQALNMSNADQRGTHFAMKSLTAAAKPAPSTIVSTETGGFAAPCHTLDQDGGDFTPDRIFSN